MPITLHQGSILDSKADYIVNPANSFLRHGGGLAAVINKAAQGAYYGADIKLLEQLISAPTGNLADVVQYCHENDGAPLVATGDIHMTSAGVLPYKGIIHAVGPIWAGGDCLELDLLEIVHERVFDSVSDGVSIALPAISSGIFGVPIEEVARIAIQIANWYVGLNIEFWLFSDEHLAAFEAAALRNFEGWEA
jgi:O-acetyl-ADP-ribose deacetylase (regulator of RNase III)